MTRTSETRIAFWDQTAETMPHEQLEQLQLSRVRSCVERLQSSDIEYYRERLGGLIRAVSTR
jgi:phenylacetate-coenzyme A ligase PaaK-like adenylate-forming protein